MRTRSRALRARIAILRGEDVMTLVPAFDGLSHYSVLGFGMLCHGVDVPRDCQTDEHGWVFLAAIIGESVLGAAGEVDSRTVEACVE